MKRGFAECVGGPHFDKLSLVHDCDPLRDIFDSAEIVRDEEEREAQLLLQADEKIEDLRLDRDVERGDRLVAYDEFGVEREGAGDADALALAAAELVRVAPFGRGGKADEGEELIDVSVDFVDFERFFDNGACRHARVERGVGILKDHL